MLVFQLVVISLAFVLLILVASVRPKYPKYSLNEMERRKFDNVEVKKDIKRFKLLASIQSLLHLSTMVLLMVLTMLLVATLGLAWGFTLALLTAITFVAFSKIGFLRKLSTAIYTKIEPRLVKFVDSTRGVFDFLGSKPYYTPNQYRKLSSREELVELIDKSNNVLTDNDKVLVGSALDFFDKQVGSIMTRLRDIKFVQKDEFLGPLVLSELSSLGHSKLPVVDKTLNQVVGTLNLTNLLALDDKKSVTAEKAMDKKVFYIHQEDSLEHALGSFLRTHHYMFIVIDDNKETVGLITFSDVIQSLIGRKIIDEGKIN